MVKNIKGGNHKNQARKHSTSNDKKLRLKKDELELYAYVVTKPGGNKLNVFCMDGETRLCTIPGKFINRGRRDNMIEKGSWLLIGLRDWESKERKNCDLLEVYNDSEKTKLKNNVNENWSIFMPKDSAPVDDIQFTNDYEEQQETINNVIVSSSQFVDMGEEIDFEDI